MRISQGLGEARRRLLDVGSRARPELQRIHNRPRPGAVERGPEGLGVLVFIRLGAAVHETRAELRAAKKAMARSRVEAEGRVGGVDEEDQILEKELFGAAAYVARQTMDAMAQLFTSARAIMDWLATCARLVAREGHAMSWVTPLGLPVVQPYRNEKKYVVKTMMQSVVLVDHSDALPEACSAQSHGARGPLSPLGQ